MPRMRLHRRARVVTSWIAVLAILMTALAPTVSQAWAAKLDPMLVQVCSVMGTKWVHTDGQPDESSPVPDSTHFTDHCPYCSLHTSALLVPAMVWATACASVGQVVPTAFLLAPRTLHAWASAQPRAPPPFS